MSQAARAANQARLQALLAGGLRLTSRKGLVTSYDPDGYAAKVMLKPEDVETGFLPIASLLAGGGWGFQAGPSTGDQAVILFEDGDPECGVIMCFLYSDEDRPARVESGEFRLTHKDGMGIKATKDKAFQMIGDRCLIDMRDGVITIQAEEIVTDGKTRLDNGVRRAAFEGATDSAGDALTEGSARVYV